MVSLLNWITGHKENDLKTELYLTFGIISFIVINLLITIYSHEFSAAFLSTIVLLSNSFS